MSDQLYPDLPGLAWPVSRAPQWKTAVQTTPSLREFRSSSVVTPVHELTLKYEFLRQRASAAEYQRLFDFFANHRGDYDTFLFNDRSDNSVSLQRLAVGTGSVTQYQLGRWMADTPYNLLPESNVMSSGANWVVSRAALAANAAAAYDGLLYASILTEDTSSGTHQVRCGVGLFDPTRDVFWAVDVKPNGRTDVMLYLFDGDTTSACGRRFNLANGTTTNIANSGSGAIKSWGMLDLGGGWYRCWVVGTPGLNPTGSALQQAQVRLGTTAGASSYTGDGVSGAQLARPMLMQTSGEPATMFVRTTGTAQFPRLEPVYAPVGAISLFSWTPTAGLQPVTPSSVSASGLVTLSSALAAGTTLLWSGGYYWRCRFADANLSFEQFMRQFWQTGRVKLRTIKP